MGATIKRNSYLNMSELLSYDGVEFWDTPSFPEVVPQDGDIFVDVTASYVGRIDLIAFDQYGDEDLWWAIALVNGIQLVPSEVTLGRRLRIPQKSYLDSLIAKGPGVQF